MKSFKKNIILLIDYQFFLKFKYIFNNIYINFNHIICNIFFYLYIYIYFDKIKQINFFLRIFFKFFYFLKFPGIKLNLKNSKFFFY